MSKTSDLIIRPVIVLEALLGVLSSVVSLQQPFENRALLLEMSLQWVFCAANRKDKF